MKLTISEAARIFAINFAMGVVTGIPMEFQFGTNWAGFSNAAGGVIGQPLAIGGICVFPRVKLPWPFPVR
jgi:cytochrome d ubiquinol oxidase subunit I